MEQTKINQLNAAKTTVAYCEATAADTASNTNFAPKVAAIKSKIVVTEGYIQLSADPVKGVTLNVKGIRAAAIENVLPLGSAIFAYASSLTPPDEDLMAKAKLVKSDLEQGSKEHCFTECQRIVTLAQANAANILPFGITALMLTDAQTVVTLFGNVINDPRAAIVSRVNAGIQAEETLASIMNTDLTLQLDPMANIFRFSKTAWWRGYRLSREVIDLGTTHTKLRATCVDINNTPIQGVFVSLVQGITVIQSKKTDIAGEVSISKVIPGNYDIHFAKSGFATQIETDYHFAPGSETIHHIILLPAAGGTTAVREANVPFPGIVNIPIVGIKGTPLTTILFEITGSAMRFFSAATPTDGPGVDFYEAQIGNAPFGADAFAQAIGLSPSRPFLNVICMGPSSGHFKMTFDNLQP